MSTCKNILISKRPDNLHKGGFWEFPGGKVEPDESEQAALARELFEELNITFDSAQHFKQIDFDYPEKSVCLDFYEVFGASDTIIANENQEWRWVPLTKISDYQFPEANEPVVKALMDFI